MRPLATRAEEAAEVGRCPRAARAYQAPDLWEAAAIQVATWPEDRRMESGVVESQTYLYLRVSIANSGRVNRKLTVC